jgi:hypothetical protein
LPLTKSVSGIFLVRHATDAHGDREGQTSLSGFCLMVSVMAAGFDSDQCKQARLARADDAGIGFTFVD